MIRRGEYDATMRIWRQQLAAGVAAFAVTLTVWSPSAWIFLPFELMPVVLVVLAGAGWGAWPVLWLGQGQRSGLQQVVLALTLGLGVLGVLVMLVGLLGLISQPSGVVLAAAGWVLGVLRVRSIRRGAGGADGAGMPALSRELGTRGERTPTESMPGLSLGDGTRGSERWVGMVCAGLAGVVFGTGVFAALLPPGALWEAEARGYDVLEYHLQAPREYWLAGAVHLLPHNVYAQFPQQVEALYLLLMTLSGDPYAAAVPSQVLHLALGGIAVLAVFAFVPAGVGRWAAATVLGTTPWLAYLGALAYVELGLLAFAAAAGGLLLWDLRRGAVRWQSALTAGLLAGFAGGCKYTALVFVAVLLGGALAAAARGGVARRAKLLAVVGIGAAAGFAPWALRGAVLTGNPVYPFAYEWFGGAAWSAEQAEQWELGHALPENERGLAARLHKATEELLLSTGGERVRLTLYGVGVWLALAAAIVGAPARVRVFVLVWLVGIVAAWMGLTFMPGRFAVPLLVPAALLVGWAATRRRDDTSGLHEGAPEAAKAGNSGGAADATSQSGSSWGLARGALVAIVLAGSVANVAQLQGALRGEAARFAERFDAPLATLLGNTNAYVRFNLVREVLPEDGYAWLVGDAAVFYMPARVHYTVVFSRDPWVTHAGAGASAAESVAWLRARGVTHVVFNWSEIERLRGTYGFSPVVTREWVAALEAAGLERVNVDEPLVRSGRYAIYRVTGS